MDGCFDRDLLKRLPLAESAFRCFNYCWDHAFLNRLFDTYATGCSTRQITFPTVVELVGDALLQGRSGNQSFTAAREDGRLQANIASMYQKLSRTPLPLSVAFLREGTARLEELFPPGIECSTAKCLRDFELRIIDGKTLKHLDRRLKPLREVRGRMLGGKLLVCLCPRRQLAIAMSADPDAFRNEAALCDDLFKQLPPQADRRSVFVADRQFCILGLMEKIQERGDHFLIRHSCSSSFTRDMSVGVTRGRDARGRRWTDCIGTLGAASNHCRRTVRMIRLERSGEEDVTLITDLTEARAYPAIQLLEAYLSRWGIETVFQQVTEVFALKQLIGGTPEAVIFQAAFCFLAYNVTQVMRAYIAQGAGRAVEKISMRKLFDDVAREMIAAVIIAGPARIAQLIKTIPTSGALAHRLQRLLGKTWKDWWIKCPTTHRTPPPKLRKARSNRASVYRLLQEAKN